MHILYVVSAIIFAGMAAKSIALFRKVSDNQLGHEEIITLSVFVLACLNISMDIYSLININWLGFMGDTILRMLLSTKIFQVLVSYVILHYVNSTYSIRIAAKTNSGADQS